LDKLTGGKAAKTLRNILVPATIIGITFYIIFSSFADVDEVFDAIRTIDLRVFGLVLALSLVNYVLRFWRWSLWLGHGRQTPVPAWRHFAIYIAGFALTTTPGKVGEAIRTLYLKPYGISHSRCVAALYNERLFDMIVISILAMLIFTASGVLARSLGLVGLGVAALLVAAQHPMAATFLERISRLAWARRIAGLLNAATIFLRDVRSMMTGRLVVVGTVVGFLAWGAEGLGTYMIAQALGIDIGLPLAIGIYATAMLAGALSFLPGGLGSTEVVMISLLVYSGSTTTAAIAATTLVRLATLWFAVVLGLGAWLGIEAFRGRTPAGSGQMSERKQCKISKRSRRLQVSSPESRQDRQSHSSSISTER
jgi:glycosyltransferase 2 family protein